MPLRALILALAIALAAAVPAPAAAAHDHPPARAVLAGCTHATAHADGTGIFEGQMRSLKGAVRMQMRFLLQTRTPGRQKWTSVAARGFGTWVTADAGTARYVYTKRVEGLLAPGGYRTVVRFRWLRADGTVRATWRDASRPCKQPDPRPNLELVAIAVPQPGRYLVTVANSGRGAVGPFAVAITVGGELQRLVGSVGLDPGAETVVELSGRECAAGAQLVAEVDPDAAVDEPDEGDNLLTRAC
jgi:CARDB protein